MSAASFAPASSNRLRGALLALSAGLLLSLSAMAQPIETQLYSSTAEDIALAKLVLQELGAQPAATPGANLMVRAARRLLGQKYVSGTQEGREERLRIYLTRTDCILFAETCLGLVQTVQRCGPGATFEDLARSLRASRYRGGTPDGYASRLHYTTEWIALGVREGLFEDITERLGGIPDTRPINFMSTHPDSYAPLKGESPSAQRMRAAITAVEQEVSRLPRRYIPRDRLVAAEGQIRSGDILCFATSIEGLDYSHVVIAYREREGAPLGFIHASSAAGEVIIEPRSLEAYLQANRRISGITVLRLTR